MVTDPKRPFRTDYPGALRAGYCVSVQSAVTAATVNCLHKGERRASVTTREGKPVASIAATPMGVLVTMHGTHRLEVQGFRHLRRVA